MKSSQLTQDGIAAAPRADLKLGKNNDCTQSLMTTARQKLCCFAALNVGAKAQKLFFFLCVCVSACEPTYNPKMWPYLERFKGNFSYEVDTPAPGTVAKTLLLAQWTEKGFMQPADRGRSNHQALP